jgi:hypothetical protein
VQKFGECIIRAVGQFWISSSEVRSRSAVWFEVEVVNEIPVASLRDPLNFHLFRTPGFQSLFWNELGLNHQLVDNIDKMCFTSAGKFCTDDTTLFVVSVDRVGTMYPGLHERVC